MSSMELERASDAFRIGVRVSVYNATLRNALRETGKNQGAIAAELGIAPMTLSNYVTLKAYPGIERAAQICAYLGRGIDDIFPEHLIDAPKARPIRLEMTEKQYKAVRAHGGFVNPWGLDRFGSDRDNPMLADGIRTALTQLTPREQRVLTLRFGLEDGRTRTYEEVGKEVGVTRERIRQIETKALRKLRYPSRARALRGFWEQVSQ